MFSQVWRDHWGLSEEPFGHEDADKDPILSRMESAAVHSSFDRIYGNPETPCPGVVFGEKGSGKSGLRLAMQRRLREHNAAHPDERVFVVEYTDFDYYLDQTRTSDRIPTNGKGTAERVLDRFHVEDHLDVVLSLAVTRLSDEWIEGRHAGVRIPRKNREDLLGLASLYYRSERRSKAEAYGRLRRALRYRSSRPALHTVLLTLLCVVAAALGLVPHHESLGLSLPWDPGDPGIWYGAGGVLLALAGGWELFVRLSQKRLASRAVRNVRVLPRDRTQLQDLLGRLSRGGRRDLALPATADEVSRYQLLQRFLGVLHAVGYRGLFVLIDRLDESTTMAAKEDWMSPFVERLLDHKLLQFDGLALKLFLPIELSKLVLGASPDALKRMRLDKAHAVAELRWTGQEIFEIANHRLRASRSESANGRGSHLHDFFTEELTDSEVRDALHELGTPRHAFGFLSSLFSEYARNLPNELDADSSDWRVPRSHFEILRSAWADRARTLRRTLN